MLLQHTHTQHSVSLPSWVLTVVASRMSSIPCCLCLGIEHVRFALRKSVSLFTTPLIIRTYNHALWASTLSWLKIWWVIILAFCMFVFIWDGVINHVLSLSVCYNSALEPLPPLANYHSWLVCWMQWRFSQSSCTKLSKLVAVESRVPVQ